MPVTPAVAVTLTDKNRPLTDKDKKKSGDEDFVTKPAFGDLDRPDPQEAGKETTDSPVPDTPEG